MKIFHSSDRIEVHRVIPHDNVHDLLPPSSPEYAFQQVYCKKYKSWVTLSSSISWQFMWKVLLWASVNGLEQQGLPLTLREHYAPLDIIYRKVNNQHVCQYDILCVFSMRSSDRVWIRWTGHRGNSNPCHSYFRFSSYCRLRMMFFKQKVNQIKIWEIQRNQSEVHNNIYRIDLTGEQHNDNSHIWPGKLNLIVEINYLKDPQDVVFTFYWPVRNLISSSKRKCISKSLPFW